MNIFRRFGHWLARPFTNIPTEIHIVHNQETRDVLGHKFTARYFVMSGHKLNDKVIQPEYAEFITNFEPMLKRVMQLVYLGQKPIVMDMYTGGTLEIFNLTSTGMYALYSAFRKKEDIFNNYYSFKPQYEWKCILNDLNNMDKSK